jgi:glycosyltransferase involved in cell wall biosynthesis
MQVGKKITVLETIRQGQIGGGESHLLSLVENLDRKQFTPIVLSFTGGSMVDRLRDSGVKTRIIYTERPFDIFKWGEVKQFIKSNDIDLIHAHGGRANSNVFWAARKLGIPVIQTVHGWSFNDSQNLIKRRIRTAGEHFLAKESALNISVSASNQQTGKEAFMDFQSVVVNNGIDLNRFNPGKSFTDIRGELNIPRESILLLFLARFAKEKQPLKPIIAFSEAVKKNPNLHLLMVGDGDMKSRAESLAIELGIAEKITFQPFRSDVPDILAASDIYLLTSLWEGMPIGLLEAMAMGKAVIVSKVDGTTDIIQDGVNGLLVDLANIDRDLAKAIIHLASDPLLLKSLGDRAKATVTDRYSALRMTKEIEDIYLQVLSAKGHTQKAPLTVH